MDNFEGKNIGTQYHVLNDKIDLYLDDYKLAVEIDKNGQKDRNEDHESQRQKEIETELGCKFIRMNPDKENYNISKPKNNIFRHIKNKMINDAEKLTKMVKQLCI